MNTSNPWGLTEQEQQVMDLLSCGTANKRVAEAMSISESTVNMHRQSACKRMGCPGNSLRAAVLWDRFAMGRTDAPG